MANRKYIVELTPPERTELCGMLSRGTLSARAHLKARILLKAVSEPGRGRLDGQPHL